MKRDYMTLFRESNGKTIEEMAKECECSIGLIRLLEDDERNVTHPNVAKRITEKYCLNDVQMELMIPENYRLSSPKYDPNHYKIEPIFIERPKPDREMIIV